MSEFIGKTGRSNSRDHLIIIDDKNPPSWQYFIARCGVLARVFHYQRKPERPCPRCWAHRAKEIA